MEKAMESFTMYQHDADEKYQKYEEERWQKDIELGEKRRREDREHDMRMVQMLDSMFQGGNYNAGQYDYDF